MPKRRLVAPLVATFAFTNVLSHPSASGAEIANAAATATENAVSQHVTTPEQRPDIDSMIKYRRWDRAYFITPWEERLSTRIYGDWVSSNLSKADLTITGTTGDDGRIYDPQIESPRISPQLQAECLQSVLFAQAFEPIPKEEKRGLLKRGSWHFDSANGKGIQFDALGKYASQPKTPIVIMRIPFDVIHRYPGVFSKDELLSPENLVELKNDDLSLSPQVQATLRLRASSWVDFCSSHSKASKEEIVRFAKQL